MHSCLNKLLNLIPAKFHDIYTCHIVICPLINIFLKSTFKLTCNTFRQNSSNYIVRKRTDFHDRSVKKQKLQAVSSV